MRSLRRRHMGVQRHRRSDLPQRDPARGRPQTLVQRAYQEIRSRILDNRYQPGFQALESELAEELGVSRTPVREALKQLEYEGLVELIPRRGFRVVPVVAADMREIYEVLTALESMASELVARRGVSDEEIAPMVEATDAMEEALEAGDLEAWARADEHYHRCLIDLSGNQRLINLALTVRDQGHRARMVTLRMRPPPVASTQEHREVLEAIRTGDWRAARELHFDHRMRASEELTRIRGMDSADIMEQLEGAQAQAVVHRDNMVVFRD